MTVLVVEVAGRHGWEEVSRYEARSAYLSGRYTPPKALTGEEMAAEDREAFEGPGGYGRPARIRRVQEG